MPIESLWAPVCTVPIFTEEVKGSIADAGLMNPLIVVRLPREDALRYFSHRRGERWIVPPQWDEAPDKPILNTIWGGSNRLAAIKELGYTHVDCVLIPSFQAATAVQEQQRASYKQMKGGEDGTAGQSQK